MAVPSTQAGMGSRSLGLPLTDLTMILVVLIWGVNFTTVKIALAEIPPLALAAIRFTSAAGLLWIILRLREGSQSIPRDVLWKLTWVGIVGNTVYQIGFTYGLKLTTAANASLLIATTPALVAGFGALLGIERLRRVTVAGIALAILGVGLVIGVGGLHLSSDEILGDVILFGCAIAWTIYTLGVRTLGGGLSPLAITTWTMITGVPGLLLLGMPDIVRVDWAGISLAAWGALVYATVLGIVIAYVLWNNSVRVAGSTRTAIYGCAIPLVATLVAWPVLGETPTWLQGVGAILIISGVLLTRKR
ncbi:MAG: DMT family transporter [Oscillochloridaceae bacterium umkhey_bin13]